MAHTPELTELAPHNIQINDLIKLWQARAREAPPPPVPARSPLRLSRFQPELDLVSTIDDGVDDLINALEPVHEGDFDSDDDHWDDQSVSVYSERSSLYELDSRDDSLPELDDSPSSLHSSRRSTCSSPKTPVDGVASYPYFVPGPQSMEELAQYHENEDTKNDVILTTREIHQSASEVEDITETETDVAIYPMEFPIHHVTLPKASVSASMSCGLPMPSRSAASIGLTRRFSKRRSGDSHAVRTQSANHDAAKRLFMRWKAGSARTPNAAPVIMAMRKVNLSAVQTVQIGPSIKTYKRQLGGIMNILCPVPQGVEVGRLDSVMEERD